MIFDALLYFRIICECIVLSVNLGLVYKATCGN